MLAERIREKGHTVYCFLDSIPEVEQEIEEQVAAFEGLDWRHDAHVREVFDVDMNGLRNSDVFVMLLPVGKSCHIEAGVAYGLGKKCVLIGEQKEAESLYLIFTEVYKTADEFLALL